MDIERMIESLAGAQPYAQLDRGVLERVARQMAPRYKKEKEAIKACKALLHGAYGLFYPEGCHVQAAQLLREAVGEALTPAREQALCRQVLGLHASTRERLADMEALYGAMFSALPPLSSVLDFGCGFHPFARPFMPLDDGCVYGARDLSPETMGLVNGYFLWAGRPGEARVWDALGQGAGEAAEAALLMKLLPVLEQQKRGAGLELLKGLDARYLVVTFPTASVSGRNVGMEAHYTRWFEGLLPLNWRVLARGVAGRELYYVVDKGEEPTPE